MSDIEKIRAEVEEIRHEHSTYHAECGESTLCTFQIVLQLAQDKLALAEALDGADSCDCRNCVTAQRVLGKVAR